MFPSSFRYKFPFIVLYMFYFIGLISRIRGYSYPFLVKQSKHPHYSNNRVEPIRIQQETELGHFTEAKKASIEEILDVKKANPGISMAELARKTGFTSRQ